ncbi:MAG: transcriptional regulator [Deltaproteobacteria bacterium HGW-Deltaproteobacteria-13]|nr:MAG: transcriptional regulator [Deltaproteobacteria bacterium HGW-Deltaproteobacteria-13]
MRKNRLDKKLLQREVGRQFGVEKDTITNWEINRTFPSLSHIPKIIKFIGYIPWEVSAQNIKLCRKTMGISQKSLAKQIGVDPSTLSRWEKGIKAPSKEKLKMLSKCFASFSLSFVQTEEKSFL